MNFTGKSVLECMHRFVSPCSSVPGNLLKVAVVHLVDASKFKKSFFNLSFNRAHILILLWAAKIRAIIADDHGYSAFWRQLLALESRSNFFLISLSGWRWSCLSLISSRYLLSGNFPFNLLSLYLNLIVIFLIQILNRFLSFSLHFSKCIRVIKMQLTNNWRQIFENFDLIGV